MSSSKYICKKCGEHYLLELHEEDNFGPAYKTILSDASKGAYGPEWQSAIENIIEVCIDCSKKLYYCDSCKYWVNDRDLSLYIPKSPEALERIRSAKARIRRFGSVPQVMRNDLKSNYQIYKSFRHVCPHCSKELEVLEKVPDSYGLPCPKCGSVNAPETSI